MPSWNIHIAHAEGLIADGGALSRVVRDRNAFLFGNLIPDIYVGYMVPAIAEPIPYRLTHFAVPEHIPKPREREFWDAYVVEAIRRAEGARAGDPDGCDVGIDAGSIAAEVAHVSPAHRADYELRADPRDTARLQQDIFESDAVIDSGFWTNRPQNSPVNVQNPRSDLGQAAAVTAAATAGAAAATPAAPAAPLPLEQSRADLILGTWVHLLADTIWNQRVHDFLDERGETPSSGFRIKKQSDFDQFGKSLSIDAVPLATPRLVELAAQFPQYPIDERSVYATVAVAHEVVRTNTLFAEPEYRLLSREFFECTFQEVQREAEERFAERAAARP
ncbi:MAG: hypothetical protein Q4B77_05380 [Coriobacteriaceae bacterium]|nr:hypothetical protein [Coriobacteriaceae bacterium]